MNESVVITFMLLFVVNFVMSAIYFQLVPPKTGERHGRHLKQVYERPLSSLDKMGEELAFYIRAIRVTPRSITRYPKEILRLLAEVTLGLAAPSPSSAAPSASSPR